MKALVTNVGLVCVAALLTGLLCGGVCFTLGSGWLGFRAAMAGAISCGAAGVAVTLFLLRHDVSAVTVLVATGMRLVLTTLIITAVAVKFPEFQILEFFLSLVVVYMVLLGIETRLAIQRWSGPKGSEPKEVG